MKVLRFAFLLALASAVVPAEAQQRVYRIGVVNAGFAAVNIFSPLSTRFIERLAELGYREGENLLLERRWAEGKAERVPELTGQLVDIGVDVIVTIGNKVQPLVQQANPRIPIVSLSCDSFASVSSYAKPNGNFTGVTCMSTELSPKRLELAKQLVPAAKRAVYLHNPGQGDVGLQLTQQAAAQLGMNLHAVEAKSAAQLKQAFATIAEHRPDVLVVYPDGLTMSQREAIVEFAAAQRLPAVYAYKEFADVGGLVSYGSTLEELAERAADLSVKILRGAKPHELPLEQATRIYLTVNLKAARDMGFKIPAALLQRADRVID